MNDFNGEVISAMASDLRRAKNIAALTGAGISTASGIPDFRGEKGLYTTADMTGVGNLSPEIMLSHGMLENNPELFFRWYRRNMVVGQRKPNAGHRFLAALEKEYGKTVQVFTQNIDGLHQSAGSKTVYELHGSGQMLRCEDCGNVYQASKVFSDGWKHANGSQAVWGSIPLCECGSMLRPDIVLYDEPIRAPNDGLYGPMLAGCEAFLVMGTSLAVYPAALIPSCAPDPAHIYVINNQHCQEFDSALCGREYTEIIADIEAICQAALGDILPALKYGEYVTKEENSCNHIPKF